jgi:hypothetical protein
MGSGSSFFKRSTSDTGQRAADRRATERALDRGLALIWSRRRGDHAVLRGRAGEAPRVPPAEWGATCRVFRSLPDVSNQVRRPFKPSSKRFTKFQSASRNPYLSIAYGASERRKFLVPAFPAGAVSGSPRRLKNRRSRIGRIGKKLSRSESRLAGTNLKDWR